MMNPKSLENLVSFADYPPEQRREIARQGGVASGKRRRHLSRLRKTAIVMGQIMAERAEREEQQRHKKTQSGFESGLQK